MSNKNLGRVYFVSFNTIDFEGNKLSSHPYLCFDEYTSNGSVLTYMLCQSNDSDEKNKYRYTFEIDTENMSEPKLPKETVVNCNVRYTLNIALFNKEGLYFKISPLGKIRKRDLVNITNLWKTAYAKGEHSLLHILNIEKINNEMFYDFVNDSGEHFKTPLKSSKQIQKEKQQISKGITR